MDDATRLRYALVEQLKQNGQLRDPAVQAALRAVPRHLFLPQVQLADVYADQAITTKLQDGRPLSSSSQPTIMAIMLEQLAPARNANVLEIGAGTGYNAALLSYLVGPQGRVTTIDIDEDIVAQARAHLAAAGAENVQVICADGGFGYPPHAPYDAIIVTVGVWDLSPHWLEQLRTGGSLVAPVSLGVRQFSIAFENTGSGLSGKRAVACGFLPLRGVFAGPGVFAESNGILIRAEHLGAPELSILNALLAQPSHAFFIPEIAANPSPGLLDYISLHGASLIGLFDREKRMVSGGLNFGLLQDKSLAVFSFSDDQADSLDPSLRVFGDDAAAERLRQFAQQWAKHNYPNFEKSSITAMPLGASRVSDDALVLRKQWMEYHIQS